MTLPADLMLADEQPVGAPRRAAEHSPQCTSLPLAEFGGNLNQTRREARQWKSSHLAYGQKTETIEKMVGYRPGLGRGARFNGARVGGRAGQGTVRIRRILAYRHGDGRWASKIAS